MDIPQSIRSAEGPHPEIATPKAKGQWDRLMSAIEEQSGNGHTQEVAQGTTSSKIDHVKAEGVLKKLARLGAAAGIELAAVLAAIGTLALGILGVVVGTIAAIGYAIDYEWDIPDAQIKENHPWNVFKNCMSPAVWCGSVTAKIAKKGLQVATG